jgi:DnaJ-domain-containing protein 1
MGTNDDRHDDHRFPGGAPRLPRLTPPRRPVPPDPTEQARDQRQDDAPAPQGTFTDYFSNESLFGASPPREEPAEAVPLPSGQDAYSLLGVSRQASWKEISRAHRRLVSELHPDRYVDSDDETRAAAERKVRDVNEAFSEIRRQRLPSRC